MSHVFITDGPHKGRSFDHSNPLPSVLVIAEPGPVYHDYDKSDNGYYQHSRRCKCRNPQG